MFIQSVSSPWTGIPKSDIGQRLSSAYTCMDVQEYWSIHKITSGNSHADIVTWKQGVWFTLHWKNCSPAFNFRKDRGHFTGLYAIIIRKKFWKIFKGKKGGSIKKVLVPLDVYWNSLHCLKG